MKFFLSILSQKNIIIALSTLIPIFLGCVSDQKLASKKIIWRVPYSEDRKVISNPIEGVTKARIQILAVSNKNIGLQILQNRLEFLRSMLKQSYGSYYNMPKYTQQCLDNNIINNMSNEKDHTYFDASLTIDDNWNPGYCEEKFDYSKLIIGFCQKSMVIYEVYLVSNEKKIKVLCESNDSHLNDGFSKKSPNIFLEISRR